MGRGKGGRDGGSDDEESTSPLLWQLCSQRPRAHLPLPSSQTPFTTEATIYLLTRLAHHACKARSIGKPQREGGMDTPSTHGASALTMRRARGSARGCPSLSPRHANPSP